MKKTLFFVLLLLVSGPVWAETINASLMPSSPIPAFTTAGSTNLTQILACQDMAAKNGFTYYSVSNNQCWVRYNGGSPYAYSNIYANTVCASAPTVPATSCPAAYKCPIDQNWTLAGTVCNRPDCVVNETRNPDTGVCVSSCLAGFDNMYGKFVEIVGSDVPIGTCLENCAYSLGDGISLPLKVPPSWLVYVGQNKGTACTASDLAGTVQSAPAVVDPMGEPPPCPTGETRVTYPFGFICAPNDVLASGDLPASAVPVGTTGGGGADTTGGAVSTTTGHSTTTTNPDGSTTTVSSSQTIVPDMSKPIVDKLEKLFGGPLDPVADVALGTKSIDVAITPVAVSGAGSCPAPSPFVLHGQTYYFEWTTYCNYAIGIKPILLAFAWLSAAGILVGGFKA